MCPYKSCEAIHMKRNGHDLDFSLIYSKNKICYQLLNLFSLFFKREKNHEYC